MGFEHSNDTSSLNDDETTDDRCKRKYKDVELYNKRSELLEKHFGYTNENNPFGDSTLVEPFVWEKKNTAPGHLQTDSITKTVQSKVDEIKQIKHRREQYELEKSLLEEHRNQTQRERDECDFLEWESRENEFTLKQIIAKSTTRSKEGREKPIDKLVLAIAEGNKDRGNLGLDVSVLLTDVSEDDVKELATIAGAYVKLYPQSELNKYWRSILAITENRLNFNYAMHDISQAVMAKIDEVLSKKSVDELTIYEDEIRKRLDGDGIVDTNFWETALSRIPYFKACRTINDLVNNAEAKTTPPKYVTVRSEDRPGCYFTSCGEYPLKSSLGISVI